MKEQCEAEADAIAKWLLSQDMKPRKTQLVVKDQATQKQRPVNCEYYLGKDLHFLILSNAKKIMKMCPKLKTRVQLNELANLHDSCNLVMTLI